ncbi:MAG: ATP-binding protein [Thermoanaerobacter sp.]|uniref:nucleotide-binding protein n=1 Tax=Desulfofundulus thermocisternus TaxID=42471 RepID=UPI000A04C03C|nr:ATP-binding protein [Desulfofundulus thermocisternus]MBE3584652.1 ATP-binding protein [Thermoanaerobacter sp.]
MLVAVASGKGGTGKTTLASSLALVAAEKGKVMFLDCDVEEPNGHIMLKPRWEKKEAVRVPVPEINQEKCTFCGRCAEICAFHALVVLPQEVLLFPTMCHGCGGCWHLCPAGAISPGWREIGLVEEGSSEGIGFVRGRLNVGEAISPPLIEAVKERCRPGELNILDAPPGTSCPVIRTVKGADFCLLVTEPTPFGLHDLELACEMVASLGVPCGVVVNRSDGDDRLIRQFCQQNNLPLLLQLPHDREVARGYARGIPAVKVRPEWKEYFAALLSFIEEGGCTGARTGGAQREGRHGQDYRLRESGRTGSR